MTFKLLPANNGLLMRNVVRLCFSANNIQESHFKVARTSFLLGESIALGHPTLYNTLEINKVNMAA